MQTEVSEKFLTPGSAYRGKPFWAWNGKLDPKELRRQIRVMHEMGLGGFFMHSRVGLDTAYLSDDWFECIGACIDEAKKLNMEAWLYDEDRWPSGAAGGLVTKNPKYRAQYLALYQYDAPSDFSWTKETLAAFTAKVKDHEAFDVKRLANGKSPKTLATGETILAFVIEHDPCSNWFNGQTYLDTMSHEAVREFIKVTHKEYEKRFGKELGKTVPGIFTDEPCHGAVMGDHGGSGNAVSVIPWTSAFPKHFKKRYGGDVLDHLPEIFFDVDGIAVSRARWQYHDCKTFLFVDAFARQVGDWCDKTGMLFTGHLYAEDSPRSQAQMLGCAMRSYEYMQAPGMDVLTEHWNAYGIAKGVSSAARQFGRRWRLTETDGCTGWDFSFDGRKRLGDWQAALGINLRCQHLAWYTMDSQAKRDFPASISYQSPWWRQYKKVEDYFARLNVIGTTGQEIRDILVLFPVESSWVRYNLFTAQGKNYDARDHAGRVLPSLGMIDQSLADVILTLLGYDLDFDLGDEDIMSRHSRVSKGKKGVRLHVGKADYKAVIVPPLATMRSSTLELLRAFRDAGGSVIFTGDPAPYLDAMPSDEVAAFAEKCPSVEAVGPQLSEALKAFRRVSIKDKENKGVKGALHLLREDKSAFYFFLCHQGDSQRHSKFSAEKHLCETVRVQGAHDFPVTVQLGIETFGAPEEWDLETGERTLADARYTKKDGWTLKTELPTYTGRVFVFPKKKSADNLAKRPGERVYSINSITKKAWNIVLNEPNVLVFNWADYVIDGKNKGHDEILQIDAAVRKELGVKPRGGAMMQPWAREKKPREETIPVRLAYSFETKAIPSGELCLGIEHPERFRMTLNGQSLSADADMGWWTDLSLRRIPIDPAMLRLGRNVIELETDYTESHGLESVYLLGNFGATVKGLDKTIIEPTTMLAIGDWVKQGLPFYSGSVVYRTSMMLKKPGAGRRLLLRTPGYCGVAVRVLVDGMEAGIAAWAPNEVDLTTFADGKRHELGIELLGHRRNSHGPFHLKTLWPGWTGPGQFITVEQKCYGLVPCGLIADPQLVVRG